MDINELAERLSGKPRKSKKKKGNIENESPEEPREEMSIFG